MNRKRWLKLILVLVMTLGMLPISALTARASNPYEIRNILATPDDTAGGNWLEPAYGKEIYTPAWAGFSLTTSEFGSLPWSVLRTGHMAWLKKDANGKWVSPESTIFTAGTYKFQLRIYLTSELYSFAKNTVLTVNGVRYTRGSSNIDVPTSYIGYSSPEYVIEESSELLFADSDSFDIPENYPHEAIIPVDVSSAVHGGTKPYTFSKASGPDWINVSSSGVITGTPQKTGVNQNLYVTVTDDNDDSRTISIAVGGTLLNPDSREEVTRVQLTWNGMEQLYYTNGTRGTDFTFTGAGNWRNTVTWYQVNGRWIKKQGDTWVEAGNRFEPGTYKYQNTLFIRDEKITEYMMSENVKVVVDGTTWRVSNYKNIYSDDLKMSCVSISSPEYTIDESSLCTVTFNINGVNAPVPDTQYVARGGHIRKPNDPVAADYNFMGWYTSPSCNAIDKFDVLDPILDNQVTLYAKWEQKQMSGSARINGSVKFYGDTLDLTLSGEVAELDPSRLRYQWLESDDKDYWITIPGATSASYTPPDYGGLGYYCCCDISATGRTGAVRSDIRYVGAKPILYLEGTVTIKDYSIYGNDPTLYCGSECYADFVCTEYDPTMEIEYQWQRSADGSTGWQDILAANDKYYTPTEEDEGKYIRCMVYDPYRTGTPTSGAKLVHYRKSFYKLTYDYAGLSDNYVNTQFPRGNKPYEITAPSVGGYEFAGWYTNRNYNERFDFSKPILKDTTIYAKYRVSTVYHTVSFDMNGHGEQIEDQIILDGLTVQKPDNPTCVHGTFIGWWKDAEGTYMYDYDFRNPVTRDFTIYANWEIEDHTLGTWETVADATYTTEGLRIRRCTVCGEIVETETIPKIPMEGLVEIDGVWYYFVNGVKQTGWKKIDGEWYWFSSSGAAMNGWGKYGGKWYYTDEKGKMLSGWVQENSKWYYMNEDGTMRANSWLNENGDWYYFNSSGDAATGWKQISGKWYWFDSNCVMLTGLNEIEGKYYYLGTDGAMQTGWKQISGNWYYFNSGGDAAIGWKEVSGKWYYMDANGAMQTGWLTINGKKYCLNSDGTMKTGWFQDGGKWYYLLSSGAAATGWTQVGGKWYYMDDAGVMRTGWLELSGKKYYLLDNGAMATGWQQIEGEWYYFNGSGEMQKGWQKIGSAWYFLNDDGTMKIGWHQENGKWYYLNASGAMVTGTQSIGGKTYTFNSSGVCLNP